MTSQSRGPSAPSSAGSLPATSAVSLTVPEYSEAKATNSVIADATGSRTDVTSIPANDPAAESRLAASESSSGTDSVTSDVRIAPLSSRNSPASTLSPYGTRASAEVRTDATAEENDRVAAAVSPTLGTDSSTLH